MAQDSFTRIHGIGCGSSALTRNTKTRGRLTIPMSPSVEATPTLATAQKSAMISEIHRSKSRQVGRCRAGARRSSACIAARSDSTRPRSAAA